MKLGAGRAQLSLVEHALCPLDPGASLHPAPDSRGKLPSTPIGTATCVPPYVRVVRPSGLSAADEFVLWGLLALTFAQPEPGPELHALPHYCLRQLGVITDNDPQGREAVCPVSRYRSADRPV